MVYGSCLSISCYAMGNATIEEIYLFSQAALEGQAAFAVHIFPFRMTHSNLERHKDSTWLAFWKQLKEGYDAFEKQQVPPQIEVIKGNYFIIPSETAAQSHQAGSLPLAAPNH